MDLSPAVTLCKYFEGFSSKPYLCPAGVPTIGYGTTFYPDGRKVTMQDSPVTEEYAEMCLEHELSRCLAAVIRLCPNLTNESIINALVDFTYNLGTGRLQTSTLRRKINAEDWIGSKEELMRWIRASGKILKGLVLRRKAECLLY